MYHTFPATINRVLAPRFILYLATSLLSIDITLTFPSKLPGNSYPVLRAPKNVAPALAINYAFCSIKPISISL